MFEEKSGRPFLVPEHKNARLRDFQEPRRSDERALLSETRR